MGHSAAPSRKGFRMVNGSPDAVRVMVFTMALLPLASLVFATMFEQLGANPTQALVRSTGDWTIRFLCLLLLVTPLRVTTQWHVLARYRRMLGLFVYFYATLHALAYSGFDMAFELSDIGIDILKRPFILVGFVGWVCLTALAFTSFSWAIKALGGKAWQRLHRLVYAVAVLAVLHFYWMRSAKNDFSEVIVYGLVLAGLLLWRVWFYLKKSAISPRIH